MPRRLRILITRTRHQASALAAQLETLGAETVLIPTVEVAPPSSHDALNTALVNLDAFDWLLFTSANAVHALADRARQQGTALKPKQVAVIGPATLKAVNAANIAPQIGSILMPETYVAESLATALLAASPHASRFLLVRAEEARDIIATTLRAAGHDVTIAPAYRNIIPPGTIAALKTLFATPELYPDIITFTSSSTAVHLFALLASTGTALPAGIALASIGPITSATLRELGYEPTIEAAEPTIDALAVTIASFISQTSHQDMSHRIQGRRSERS